MIEAISSQRVDPPVQQSLVHAKPGMQTYIRIMRVVQSVLAAVYVYVYSSAL